MKEYEVIIYLDAFECKVKAKTKAEARKKAIERMNKRKPSGFISQSWRNKRKEIDVEEL